ncbi:MAG: transglutaminase domain-containing protein [Phycisphaeraceae bacterium]|nr:transglutaminase domain-containing protein [Phycisphaeraceae bacterium]
MKLRAFAFVLLSMLSLARGVHAADPTIPSVNQRENDNRAAMHTAKFSTLETRKYTIWRRSASATVEVEVSADFSDAAHEIAIDVSNSFIPTPLSITLSPSPNAPAPGAWGAQYLGLKTVGNKRYAQVAIQIADGVGIGKYTLSAVVRKKGQTTALARTDFPKPVVILFNPWSDRDPVYMKEADRLGEYVYQQECRYRTEVNNLDRTWRLAQFDVETIDALLKMLDVPNPAKPDEHGTTAQRENPIEFSRLIAQSIEKYVFGDWVLTQFGQGETSPAKWVDSADVFRRFNAPPVKYARCWVYANLLTSLFRCAGLPARSVSCIKSAHESQPPNGFVDIFQKKVGNNWVTDTDLTSDRAWGFHAWTEAWMKRPDLVSADGWQAVDGTYGTGPAAIGDVAKRKSSNYESASFVAAVSTPIRIWRNNKIESIDTKSIGEKIMTKKLGVAGEENIVKNYKPAARNVGPGEPAVLWDVPLSRTAGDDVVVTAHLSNSTLAPVIIDLTVSAYAEGYDQTLRGQAWSPESRQVIVAPGTPDHAEVFTIPWSAYQSFAAISDHLRVDAFAVCDAIDTGWPSVTYVVIDGPQFGVTRASPPIVAPGGTSAFDVALVNTASTTLTNCRVTLQRLGVLDDGSAPEVIDVGSVAPGASMTWSRDIVAAALGSGGLAASIASDQQSEWNAYASVEVSGCAADFNSDGFVDDADFVIFAASYDLLTVPPAEAICDLNGDDFVDDVDFELFADAYDAVYCLFD